MELNHTTTYGWNKFPHFTQLPNIHLTMAPATDADMPYPLGRLDRVQTLTIWFPDPAEITKILTRWDTNTNAVFRCYIAVLLWKQTAPKLSYFLVNSSDEEGIVYLTCITNVNSAPEKYRENHIYKP